MSLSSIKKSFLFLAVLVAISSCANQSIQTIDLDISLKNIQSNYGNYKKVKLEIYDERENKNFIGKKIVGGIFVNINSNQSLIDLVQNNITIALKLKGFDPGNDKVFEVHIANFEYYAKRDFFIGHSKANILFKIVVRDKYDTNKRYQKNYGLTINKDHFIMPLMKTDEATINYMLQEIFNDIFKDNNLMDNLRS